jgi:hypothetical protein
MSIENSAENIQDDITMEFPCITIENDGKKIFSWEDDGFKKPPTDRAFAIQTEDMQPDFLPLLFQINSVDEKSVEASKRLWELPMYNPEVYEVLVNTGLEIVEEVNNIFFTDKTPISVFSKIVEIEGSSYRITYMSDKVNWVEGTSMRDNYAKRIKDRNSEDKRGTTNLFKRTI